MHLDHCRAIPLRKFAFAAGLMLIVLGLSVLVGWAFGIATLKSVIPDSATMKANTAAIMFLCGLALALLSEGNQSKRIRQFVAAMSVLIVSIGALTLMEYFTGWNFGIDQRLFRDAVGGVATLVPGRMSPTSAMGIVFAGSALFVASLRDTLRWRLPMLSAMGAATSFCGAMALAAYFLNDMLHLHLWTYADVAIHTATGFMLLGAGLLALVRDEGGLRWSLDRTTTTGILISVALLLAVTVISNNFTYRMQQDDSWVSHTQEVLKVIAAIDAGSARLESVERVYIITGNEDLLKQRKQTEATVLVDVAELRTLTADNMRQQRRLDQFEPLIPQRNSWADRTIAVRRESGFPAAKAMIASGTGIILSTQVHDVLSEMRDEEDALLNLRRQQSNSTSTKMFLLLPLGLFLSLTILSVALFFLDAGMMERNRVGEALRESEERFHAMLNGIPQLAWMAEADGHIFWYNQGWYEYTGTTSEEMAGWGWKSVHDPAFLPKVLEKWTASIAQGTAFEMEFPLRAADGGFGTFLTRIVPLKDPDGRVVRWFGTNTDISERARAEQRLAELARELSRRAEELASSREALEAQTAMFKLVLASMGEGLIAADLEGCFLIFNDAAHDLMGRGPEDLPTEQWTSHYKVFLPDGITPYPPDRLPLVRAIRGESVQVELIVQSSEARSMDVTARPLRDARGNLCGGVAVLRDVTERKRREEELVQQAQELLRSRQALETQTLMLQSVLDSMVEGLVAADENGKFILWNPAAEKIVGLSAANVPPEEWSAHYSTYLPDMVTLFPPEQNPLLRAIRGEVSTALMFLRNPAFNRAAWIESNGAPLRDKDGVVRGGVVAFRDITQRKADELEIWKLNEHLEQRIVERTAQLEAANKELEAFSYSVAHDLRAPLRHIDGFSRILAEQLGGSLDKDAQHYLESIQDSTRNMGNMVDEMLNLSRVARMELNLQVTGLSSLVEEVLKDLEPELKDRDIEWKIAGLPFVECDPILAKQVFVNLLSNAVKFTRTRPRAIIEVGQRDVDGQSAIYIRDNGVGFSMKYSNKLFGVFQRLHRQEDFEGTGVGLATVQRIVQKHGGRVWAEAELNTGATFYFTLGTEVQTAGLIKELSYEGS